MMEDRIVALTKEVEKIILPCREVYMRKMFGCNAFFANGEVFALIWKLGSVAVKIVDKDRYSDLASAPGVEPWIAGNRTMEKWLLLPERFSVDRLLLERWVVEALREALGRAKP